MKLLYLKKFIHPSIKNFCIFLILFGLVILVWHNSIQNATSPNDIPLHMVLYSTFYYKTSKVYAPNTIIMLFDAPYRRAKMSLFSCTSRNETATQTTEALVRIGNGPGSECSWDFFIGNCTTVENPTYFALTTLSSSSASSSQLSDLPIKFELPVAEKYPVVMCYPPMVYEGRWQQLVFAIEIYKYYGADLQIQYVNSAMKEIIDLLEIYESKGIIKIEKFAFVDFDAETIATIGVHPMHELNFRNQPLALTDCLMRYRESAEFIIVADVDDVFFPPRKPYYNEFSFWNNIYPNASAFLYYRTPARITIETNLAKFSLFETIKSLRTNDTRHFGKSVYQTKNVETAWIHWPGLNNATVVEIPPEDGSISHVHICENSTQEFGDENNYIPFTKISNEDIKNLHSNFQAAFQNFPNISSNLVYANAISKCYGGHSNLGKKKQCLTPITCEVPPIVENFKCNVAKRNYKSVSLSKNLVIHFPDSDHYYWEGLNGCKIFLNSGKTIDKNKEIN